jgi:tripartite-type tricarboxylate transporter receptor subunit TctC
MHCRSQGLTGNGAVFSDVGNKQYQAKLKVGEMVKYTFKAFMVAALTLTAVPVQAQDFSDGKPIRMIVGVAAGGATDVTARIIAQKMTQSLGTTVIVENKTGAFFEPAYREVVNATPDGRTIFMISASTTVTQPGRKDFAYDIRKLEAIAEVSEGPFILTTRKTLPVKNLAELVAYGKANPGKLSFGSGGGAASSLSLAAELFKLRSGLTIINVPYKGAANALTDLLGGHIDAMFDALPVQVPQVKSGAVTGIAVTSAKRSPALPDVPTMMESGFKDFEAYNYFGLLATPGTPKPVIAKLREAVLKAVAAPDVIAEFEKQGMQPVGGSSEAFAKMLSEDLERWTKVIKEAGIEPQ